jgi:hypothetical protein
VHLGLGFSASAKSQSSSAKKADASAKFAWCYDSRPLEEKLALLDQGLNRHDSRYITTGDFNDHQLDCLKSLFPPSDLISEKVKAKLHRCITKAKIQEHSALVSFIGIFVGGEIPFHKTSHHALLGAVPEHEERVNLSEKEKVKVLHCRQLRRECSEGHFTKETAMTLAAIRGNPSALACQDYREECEDHIPKDVFACIEDLMNTPYRDVARQPAALPAIRNMLKNALEEQQAAF